MRRHFTLIEMLIVVAIIAILAALLSPSLQKAIQQAQGVACANNMRNIYLAFTAYSHDNHGLFPPLSIHKADNSWVSWWHTEVTGRYLDVQITWQNSNGQKTEQIHCPAAAYLGIGYNNSDYPYPNFNTNVLEYDKDTGGFSMWKPTWRPISRGRRLNRLLILADSLNQGGNPSDSFGNVNDRIAYRHAAQANATFGDGHVGASRSLYLDYLEKRITVQLE